MQRTPAFALSALALTGALACGLAQAQTSEPVIGLITKTETNPFFVKMKEGATAEAKKLGAKVVSAAGKTDGDNAGQVTAMENLMAAGAKTILITPSDAKAIVPAIKKAQAKGVMVIALDSPTDPADATDALFATDNYKAGELIGQYAKAALAGKKKAIKLCLMDNHIVVGVGNIYANEALFAAGIHPEAEAGKIDIERLTVLVAEVKQILAHAIKQGGTTLKDFTNADGKPGYFAQKLHVYSRGGETCTSCGNLLSEIRLGQRTTVFCGICQTR